MASFRGRRLALGWWSWPFSTWLDDEWSILLVIRLGWPMNRKILYTRVVQAMMIWVDLANPHKHPCKNRIHVFRGCWGRCNREPSISHPSVVKVKRHGKASVNVTVGATDTLFHRALLLDGRKIALPLSEQGQTDLITSACEMPRKKGTAITMDETRVVKCFRESPIS